MLFYLAQLLGSHVGEAIRKRTLHQVATADAVGVQALCMLGDAAFVRSSGDARGEFESRRREAWQVGLVGLSHLAQPLQKSLRDVAFDVGVHGLVCSAFRSLSALRFAQTGFQKGLPAPRHWKIFVYAVSHSAPPWARARATDYAASN